MFTLQENEIQKSVFPPCCHLHMYSYVTHLCPKTSCPPTPLYSKGTEQQPVCVHRYGTLAQHSAVFGCKSKYFKNKCMKMSYSLQGPHLAAHQ